MTRRVVVTGAAGVCALGSTWQEVRGNLAALRNCVQVQPGWDAFDGLNTRLAAPVCDFAVPAHYDEMRTRAMGRVALMAVRATELALAEAGLLDDPRLRDGSAGVAYGSCTGSTQVVADLKGLVTDMDLGNVTPLTYLRLMSHTAAVSIGQFFGLTGRLLPTPSACTAGSQSIGYASEAIRMGRQTLMIAGGAEELCPSEAAVFDVLYATSTRNETPHATPRPFDRDRDGLVVGEGAGTLILEERDHALARGATILAELVGFGTNADGAHVTRPNEPTMGRALEIALGEAGLPGSEIGYVCAHGTATQHGDIAESHATARVLGRPAPISSLKSYIGHTLGACGALEAWLVINMMNDDWYPPTINLERVDERCAELDFLQGAPCSLSNEYVMSNNFAFGGINTSLIFRRT